MEMKIWIQRIQIISVSAWLFSYSVILINERSFSISFSIIRETKSLLDSLGDLQLTAQLHVNPQQEVVKQILGRFLLICILSMQQCQSWQLKRWHFPKLFLFNNQQTWLKEAVRNLIKMNAERIKETALWQFTVLHSSLLLRVAIR